MYRNTIYFSGASVSSDRFCLLSERRESKSRCEKNQGKQLWVSLFDWKIAITFLELLRTAGMNLLGLIWDLREVSELRRVCFLLSCLVLSKGYEYGLRGKNTVWILAVAILRHLGHLQPRRFTPSVLDIQGCSEVSSRIACVFVS